MNPSRPVNPPGPLSPTPHTRTIPFETQENLCCVP